MTTTTVERAHPELKGSDRVIESCHRCGGFGEIGYGNVVSAHYMGGAFARTCFDCLGKGTVSVLVSSVRARESRRKRAEIKRAEEAERYRVEAAAREEREEAERVERERVEAERRESIPVIEPGRYEIVGEIVHTRYEEPYVRWGVGSYKMLVVAENGQKFWGTIPSGVEFPESGAKGCTIAFVATVEPSRNDDRFGIVKRPAKARVVAVPAIETTETEEN